MFKSGGNLTAAYYIPAINQHCILENCTKTLFLFDKDKLSELPAEYFNETVFRDFGSGFLIP